MALLVAREIELLSSLGEQQKTFRLVCRRCHDVPCLPSVGDLHADRTVLKLDQAWRPGFYFWDSHLVTALATTATGQVCYVQHP